MLGGGTCLELELFGGGGAFEGVGGGGGCVTDVVAFCDFDLANGIAGVDFCFDFVEVDTVLLRPNPNPTQ